MEQSCYNKLANVDSYYYKDNATQKCILLIDDQRVTDGCSEFIVDETVNKIGSEFIWLWIAIEPTNKEILAFGISKERNMFVAERFLSNLSQRYDKHSVSTDSGTWYLQACKFLKLDHHINSSYEKSIIERAIQYIRDKTECFDDYFSMQKKGM